MFAMEDDVFRFIYYSKKHSLNNCQIRSSGCSHNYQKSAMEKINNDLFCCLFAKKIFLCRVVSKFPFLIFFGQD